MTPGQWALLALSTALNVGSCAAFRRWITCVNRRLDALSQRADAHFDSINALEAAAGRCLGHHEDAAQVMLVSACLVRSINDRLDRGGFPQ